MKPITIKNHKNVEGDRQGRDKAVSFRLVGYLQRKLVRRFPALVDPDEPEHPWIPVGIILISAEILKTTDVDRLVSFTGYCRNFIAAVALNLIQNEIWSGCGRVGSRRPEWFSPDWVITNEVEFCERIQVACGESWTGVIDHTVTLDPSKIFDDDRSRRNAQ